MNSFLQTLYMTNKFRKRVLSMKFNSLQNFKQISSGFQLQRLFALLLYSKRRYIIPNFFKAILPDYMKNSHQQQDSSEFGKIYLDCLETSLKFSNDDVL